MYLIVIVIIYTRQSSCPSVLRPAIINPHSVTVMGTLKMLDKPLTDESAAAVLATIPVSSSQNTKTTLSSTVISCIFPALHFRPSLSCPEFSTLAIFAVRACFKIVTFLVATIITWRWRTIDHQINTVRIKCQRRRSPVNYQTTRCANSLANNYLLTNQLNTINRNQKDLTRGHTHHFSTKISTSNQEMCHDHAELKKETLSSPVSDRELWPMVLNLT